VPLTRSYIVRVYRTLSHRQVNGVVEVVRTGRLLGFRGADELWTIISGKRQSRASDVRKLITPSQRRRT
jgi:hypothetical protein